MKGKEGVWGGGGDGGNTPGIFWVHYSYRQETDYFYRFFAFLAFFLSSARVCVIRDFAARVLRVCGGFRSSTVIEGREGIIAHLACPLIVISPRAVPWPVPVHRE